LADEYFQIASEAEKKAHFTVPTPKQAKDYLDSHFSSAYTKKKSHTSFTLSNKPDQKQYYLQDPLSVKHAKNDLETFIFDHQLS
jgi:hypothetical protein